MATKASSFLQQAAAYDPNKKKKETTAQTDSQSKASSFLQQAAAYAPQQSKQPQSTITFNGRQYASEPREPKEEETPKTGYDPRRQAASTAAYLQPKETEPAAGTEQKKTTQDTSGTSWADRYLKSRDERLKEEQPSLDARRAKIAGAYGMEWQPAEKAAEPTVETIPGTYIPVDSERGKALALIVEQLKATQTALKLIPGNINNAETSAAQEYIYNINEYLKFMNGFESDEDYAAYLAQTKQAREDELRRSSFDPTEGRRQLELMYQHKAELEAQNNGSEYVSNQLALVNKQIADLEGNVSQWEKDKKYSDYAALSGTEDFEANSGYESQYNKDDWNYVPNYYYDDSEMGYGDVILDMGSWINTGEADELYEYINGNPSVRALHVQNAGSASGDPLNVVYGIEMDPWQVADQMTDEEKSIFNYIYKTRGKDDAHEYFDFLKDDLNKRNRLAEQAKAEELGKQHPLLASLMAIAYGPTKMTSLVGQSLELAATGDIDPNAPYNKWSYIPTAAQSAVSQEVEKVWGKPGTYAYDIGMSIANNLYNMAVSGGFGEAGALSEGMVLALMGSGAAADTVLSAKEKGLSGTQALLLGVINGAIEIVTEKIGFDNLYDNVINGNKPALTKIISQMLSETSEEGLAEIADDLAEILVAGMDSERLQRIQKYQQEGYTPGQAMGKAFGDLGVDTLLAMLGGFVSGGAFGVGGTVLAGINDDVRSYQYEQALGHAFETLYGVEIDDYQQFAEQFDAALAEQEATARELAPSAQTAATESTDILPTENAAESLQRAQSEAVPSVTPELQQAALQGLQSMAATLGENGNKAMTANFDESSPVRMDDYVRDFSALYNAAREGRALPEQTPYLTQAQQRAAYDAGIADRAQTLQTEQKAPIMETERTAAPAVTQEAAQNTQTAVEVTPYKQAQFEALQNAEVTSEYIEPITSPEQIKTYAEAVAADRADFGSTIDFDLEAAEQALSSDEITVYSPRAITAGSYVTPSRMNAEDAATGGGRIYSMTVPLDAVAWTDAFSGQYTGEMEGIANGRENGLDTRSAGNISQRTGEQGRAVPEGSEGARGERGAGSPAQRAGEKGGVHEVDAQKLFRTAKPGQTVRTRSEPTERTRNAFRLAEKNGVKNFITFENEIETTTFEKSIRAYYNPVTGQIGVQSNNPNVEPEDLARHDIMELKLDKGQVSVGGILENAAARPGMSMVKLNAAASIYYESWAKKLGELTEAESRELFEHAKKELVCDGADHINQLRPAVEKGRTDLAGLAVFLDEVLDALNGAANELTGGAFELEGELTESKNAAPEKGGETGLGETQFSSKITPTQKRVLDLDIAWDPNESSSIKEQLLQHIDEVKDMEPVTSVDYERKSSAPYYKVLDDILSDRFGYKIARADGISFLFDSESIKSIRHYIKSDAEAAAAISAPYVVKRGKIISGHKNHKGGRYPSITIAAPATLNGKTGTVAVAVLFADKDRVHSLRVLTPEGKEFVLQKNEAVPRMSGVSANTEKTISDETASKPTVPQPGDSVKTEFSSQLDTDYLAAVEKGDLETAQRMVDEAAKKAGYDYHLYHGTNADFTKFDVRKFGGKNGKGEGYGIYLASNKEISEPYGKNLIDAYVKFNRLAEGTKRTLTAAEVKSLIKASCEAEARTAVEDGEYDTLSEALKDSWVSNYVYTYDYPSMSRVYTDVADKILQTNENDGDIINEIMLAAGKHYNYESAMSFYDDILTPITGIDGFHYVWGKDNDVYLAFNSEQIKKADPVTYDDEGNVIPLSERFNSENPDIRYSASLLDLESLEEQNEQLRKDLQATTEALAKAQSKAEYWEGQTKRSKAPSPNPTDINRLAHDIIGSTDTNLKANDIKPELTELAEFIMRGGDGKNELTFSGVKERAVGIAHRMLENYSELLDSAAVTDYKDIRKRIRDYGTIQVPGNDLPPDWTDWKRRNGWLRVAVSTGTPLDVVYSDLSESYPWIFPPDANPGSDQLYALVDGVRAAEPSYWNPNDENMAAATEYLANRIIDGVIEDVSQDKTFADRAAKRLSDLRIDSKEKLRAQKAELQRAVRETRARSDERLNNLKAHYKEVQENARARKYDSAQRSRLLKIAKRLQNKKLPSPSRALVNEYIGYIDTVAKSMTAKTKNNLLALKELYDNEVAKDKDFEDAELKEKIDRLSKTQIADMSLDEVQDLIDVLLGLEHQFATAKKELDSADRRDVYQKGMQIISDVENSRSEKLKRLDDLFIRNTLSPLREIRRQTGYVDDDPLYASAQRLNRGQLMMNDYIMRNTKTFNQWVQDEEFMQELTGKKAKGIKIRGYGKNGQVVEVEITPDMRVALYLHSKNKQNVKHISSVNGGLKIPDMKLYRAGKIAEAYDQGTKVRLTEKDISYICSNMTAKERAFAEAIYKYFNTTSRNALGDVFERLKGYPMRFVEDYFPIESDKAYTKSEADNIQRDVTLEGAGWLKERVNNASNPIKLSDASSVLLKAIQSHGKYAGLAIPIRDFNKLYKMTGGVYDAEGNQVDRRSVQDTIKEQHGGLAIKYIDKMLEDLQQTFNEDNSWSDLFRQIRSNYAGATLALNLSVAMKQAGSYPTAAAVLGWKPLARALADFGKVDLEAINEMTPLQWLRSQGYSTPELGNLKARGKKLPTALNWIQGMDLLTTRKLWKACEYYMQYEHADMKPGTQEYKDTISELYNRVIEETQPNYTVMQRPQLLRTNNDLLRDVSMFKTQLFQNFNILYDAFGNMAAKQQQYQANPNEETKAKYDEARKNAGRATSALIVQSIVIAAVNVAWNALRGKLKRYKDEDKDKITGWSFAKRFGLDVASGFFSMVPFGSEVFSMLSSRLTGDKWYGFEGVTTGALTDAISALGTAIDQIGKSLEASKGSDTAAIQKQVLAWEDIAEDVAKTFGIPAENVMNLIKGVYGSITKTACGKYYGEYLSMLATTPIENNKGKYYDLLYNAEKSGNMEQFWEIYNSMVALDAMASEKKSTVENIDAALKQREKKDK